MRKLFESPSLVDLRLLADHLEGQGIKTRLLNEHQGGTPVVPHWGLSVWAELWVVNSAQYDRAEMLMRQYQAQLQEEGAADWLCPGCGESNPASFEACWHCGAAPPTG